MEDGDEPFVLTADHERWAASAQRKHGRRREYWRDLVERQRGRCAFSGASMLFGTESGTAIEDVQGPHPLYAAVDHSAAGSDRVGHEIVCFALNDPRGICRWMSSPR